MTTRPTTNSNEDDHSCGPPPAAPSTCHHNRKPNSSLSIDERQQKRNLKKRLKIQQRIQKLRKRIQHAKSRRDKVVEQRTKEELRLYLLKNGMSDDIGSEGNNDANTAGAMTTSSPGDEMMDTTTTAEKKKASVQSLVEEESTRSVLSVSSRLFTYAATDDATATATSVSQNARETDDDSISNIPLSTEAATKQPAAAIEPNNDNNDLPPQTDKITQTNQAIQLLRHMTKGTQSISMFDNKQALWGYTRQKFYERAMLVVRSLAKLSDLSSATAAHATDKLGATAGNDDDITVKKESDLEGMSPEQILLGIEMWSHLMKIKTACSIGCGPGNDIVGLVSLLRAGTATSIAATTTATNTASNVIATENKTLTRKREYSLETIHLLDFAIVQWEETVLEHLKSILVPEFVDFMECGYCDVMKPPSTQNQPGQFNQRQTKDDSDKDDVITNEDEDGLENTNAPVLSDITKSSIPAPLTADIILISYLLSETRGKWDTFLQDVITQARPGTLFYFAEPTPWQLFRVCEMFSEKGDQYSDANKDNYVNDGDDHGNCCNGMMQFLWIDSSMHHPTLQGLDGRLGPAVLLGIKR